MSRRQKQPEEEPRKNRFTVWDLIARYFIDPTAVGLVAYGAAKIYRSLF